MRKSRLIAVALCSLWTIWLIHFAANHIRQFGPISGHTIISTEGPNALVRSLRPNYPYSIIGGGAYSPGELQFADSKDPIVRTHYSDFDLKNTRMVRLIDDRFQYVSYRIKNQVYWTRKKLRIPSGELLLTDGVQYARARCGNRLSDKPPKSAAANPHEPEAAVLSLPAVSLDLLPKLDLANTPVPRNLPAESESRTSATAPPSATVATPNQPLIPLEAVWGGQPISASGDSEAMGTHIPSSSTPTITGSARTGMPPGSINREKTPPGDIAPVPEPSTAYLFLVTLIFTLWAVLRKRGSRDKYFT